jgi:hypothetical protein
MVVGGEKQDKGAAEPTGTQTGKCAGIRVIQGCVEDGRLFFLLQHSGDLEMFFQYLIKERELHTINRNNQD